MTISSVSTSYLGTAMLPGVQQAQAQLTQLETEVSTGQYADLGLQLGDQSGYELSLRNQDDLLTTLTASNALASASLSTASNAIDSVRTTAQTTLQSLVQWSSSSTQDFNLQNTGDDALQSFASALNATTGDQYVFGGINSSQAPISGFAAGSNSQTALVQAFTSQFGFGPGSPGAATVSAADMQTFLNGPFAQQFTGANWSANWSSASSTNTSAEIAPGLTVDTSTNANQPGFQQIAQAYAMLAVFGGSQLNPNAMGAVVTTAQSLLSEGIANTTATESQVGASQAQITQANADMGTQMSLLKNQIGSLDNINASQVATQLNSLTTQIETAYQMTAQLQKLSLAQYIPT